MIQPWWGRCEEMDGEIQSLMGTSELTVWMDSLHNCIHIMQGDYEFTSVEFPLNDNDRDDLRQQAYLLHNGLDEAERQRITDANEKREAYGEQLKAEADAEVQDFGVWEYKNRFMGPQNTPMFIVPEGK
jgi:hypothetical protein